MYDKHKKYNIVDMRCNVWAVLKVKNSNDLMISEDLIDEIDENLIYNY